MPSALEISQRLRREPFHPFKVTLSSSEMYVVHRSQDVLVSNMDMHIGLDPDEGGMPRRTVYMPIEAVTSIAALAKSITTPEEPGNDVNGKPSE